MDLESKITTTLTGLTEEAASYVISLSHELYPHVAGFSSGIRDRQGHELEFPSAFRPSRRDGKPRGIIKLVSEEPQMIRNETEYQEAARRLAEEAQRFHDHRVRLKETGLSDAEIKRVIDPLASSHLQMNEEIEALPATMVPCLRRGA